MHRLPGVQGEAPTLIGWSLGGLYARELAKLPGAKVRQVITIGTPFNGSPQQTHAGWLYRVLNGAQADLEPALLERLSAPPSVPTTSIYSHASQPTSADGALPGGCVVRRCRKAREACRLGACTTRKRSASPRPRLA